MPVALRLGAYAVPAVKVAVAILIIGLLTWGASRGGQCGDEDICDTVGLAFALLLVALAATGTFLLLAGAHVATAILKSVVGVAVTGLILVAVDGGVLVLVLSLTLGGGDLSRWSIGIALFTATTVAAQLAVVVGAIVVLIRHARRHTRRPTPIGSGLDPQPPFGPVSGRAP